MKVLWTDGSAVPNPGAGGWAVLEDGEPVALGGEARSTNIRMEGLALIAAMKYVNGEKCEIHTDSEFWVNVLTKWAAGWEARGWRKSRGKIQNLDLVQEAYKLYSAGNVKLVWVRGHVGTELNELADEWANRARMGERVSAGSDAAGFAAVGSAGSADFVAAGQARGDELKKEKL